MIDMLTMGQRANKFHQLGPVRENPRMKLKYDLDPDVDFQVLLGEVAALRKLTRMCEELGLSRSNMYLVMRGGRKPPDYRTSVRIILWYRDNMP